MNLNHPLPDIIARKLAERIGGMDRPSYAVPADLTGDGRYGQTWLVMAGGQVAVCDERGPLTTLRLVEIKEVKVDELFGGARLIAETESGEKSLIRYTKACVPEFAAMCRVLNDLIARQNAGGAGGGSVRLLSEVRAAFAGAGRALHPLRPPVGNPAPADRVAQALPVAHDDAAAGDLCDGRLSDASPSDHEGDRGRGHPQERPLEAGLVDRGHARLRHGAARFADHQRLAERLAGGARGRGPAEPPARAHAEPAHAAISIGATPASWSRA